MERYVRCPIYPKARFLEPQEREWFDGIPALPEIFAFGDNVYTMEVQSVCRGLARKAGGRGFRVTGRLTCLSGQEPHARQSVVWFDNFLFEWFVEVPESRVPVDWNTATQLSDLAEFYPDGDYQDY